MKVAQVRRVQRDPACSAGHWRQRETPGVKKIYVGNLSFSATEEALRSLFAKYGTVGRVNIVTERESGEPRGFAFVEMEDDAEAVKAINALNGTDVEGRTLTVNEARPKTEKTREDRPGGSGFRRRRW